MCFRAQGFTLLVYHKDLIKDMDEQPNEGLTVARSESLRTGLWCCCFVVPSQCVNTFTSPEVVQFCSVPPGTMWGHHHHTGKVNC